MDKEAADRLRLILDARWPQERGGISAFMDRVREVTDGDGFSRSTLYAWLRGADPTYESLGQLARALDIKRWELVAMLDGDLEPVSLGALPTQTVREYIDQMVREGLRAAEMTLRAPRTDG